MKRTIYLGAAAEEALAALLGGSKTNVSSVIQDALLAAVRSAPIVARLDRIERLLGGLPTGSPTPSDAPLSPPTAQTTDVLRRLALAERQQAFIDD